MEIKQNVLLLQDQDDYLVFISSKESIEIFKESKSISKNFISAPRKEAQICSRNKAISCGCNFTF